MAKMFDLRYPWKYITIQKNVLWLKSWFWLLCKNNAFSFGLIRIDISPKLKILSSNKALAQVDHGLESTPASREQENVICKNHCTKEDSIDVAAKLGLPQYDQQLVYVDCKEDTRAHSTLPDTIAYREPLGVLAAPLDIALLVAVNKQN